MARIPEEYKNKTSYKFQKRLLYCISELDCNKNDFAKLAGVNKDVITRAAVYGIIPTVRSLTKIADYLNISISYLLGESDDETFFKSDSPTTFHLRLKQLSEENNTKFSSISNKMPFAKNSIYEWMRTGALPSLEYLFALAKYFNVSPDYLLGRTDDRN